MPIEFSQYCPFFVLSSIMLHLYIYICILPFEGKPPLLQDILQLKTETCNLPKKKKVQARNANNKSNK